MYWRYLLPMSFSVGAMLAGFISIIKAAEGSYMVSSQLIMLSMILDGFDGNLARRFNATSDFGGEFDTYVDIMSFGIAPALLAYFVALQHFGAIGLLFCCVTVLSGISRLSRFRAIDDDRGMKGYTGLPITVNAGWVALMVYVAYSAGETGVILESGIFASLTWAVSLALVILQVSTFKYGKPSKNWAFMTLGAFAVAGLFFPELELGMMCAIAICAYGLFYSFVTPILPRFSRATDDEEAVFPS